MKFEDTFQVTAALIMPDPENKMRDKLQSGESVTKPITHKNTNGIPLCSSVAVVSASTTEFKFGEEALFSADSMTKSVTAAALLRMIEEPTYSAFFPNGAETKLKDLLPLLQERFPNSEYLKNGLGQELDEIKRESKNPDAPNEITLRNLSQHTSSLSETSREAMNKKLQSSEKLSVEEILDVKKAERDSKYGEYHYSNLGYELLGAVLVAAHSAVNTKESKYSEVAEELVIGEVRKKTSSDLTFFASDQMEMSGGKTRATSNPELEIKFGKTYLQENFGEVASHRYDIAAGGSYCDPESAAKIMLHILHRDKDFSIFKEQSTLDLFNQSTVPSNIEGRVYGFGYNSFSDPIWQQYRYSGGLGYGSNSNAFVNLETNKAAVAMVSFEQNLTLPLAEAEIKGKATYSISLTPQLYEKSLELKQNHSEEELLEMRRSLAALDLATKPSVSPKPTENRAEKGKLESQEL